MAIAGEAPDRIRTETDIITAAAAARIFPMMVLHRLNVSRILQQHAGFDKAPVDPAF
jgi:hypothetical protein